MVADCKNEVEYGKEMECYAGAVCVDTIHSAGLTVPQHIVYYCAVTCSVQSLNGYYLYDSAGYVILSRHVCNCREKSLTLRD